jgi:hypothetical protein
VPGTSFGSQFGVNVGGGRQFSTEYQIDGMNLSYQGIGPGVPLSSRPDQDIISELKVQIGVPTAEYGRTSGGVVEYITRSGTNELHGNVTAFIRNTKFNARPYNASTRAVDQRWEGALSAGGPVWIPKLYDGRNKTFWFFNYTAFRLKPGGGPQSATVPTLKQRQGDFSELAGSEVAHRGAPVLATVRRSNVVCGFPAPRFHEDALFCNAIEGISLTSCTNPYSP